MDIVERFLKYVSFETTSDAESETCPSSPKELELGRFLAEEMKAIGLENARIDADGYVYGQLPASPGCEALPVIGLIAHLDTSDGASGADIKPRILHYEGGDIALSDAVSIDEKTFDFLKNYKGQDLIVTDGTTLLGADDKAGVAEILTAMEYLIAHPEIRHGRIAVGFTPDEEIGRGADRFDIKGFGADWAYTVDGGTLGELEYENFNAASARVIVHGVNVHPGSAKNKMK
ncbi:MAG: tripeptide aminopeptidase PepT, partial [Lachnospiraceae bacterium]|nr:tripeptide aminopeptidase PepT [Lachnospiraceae bacterium]